MAQPPLGTLIYLGWGGKSARVIQARPDTWANKALAKEVDVLLEEKDAEKILWFDNGAEVITERVKRG